MARTVTSRLRVRGAVAVVGLLAALTGCATPSLTPVPGTDEPATTRIPVIVDTDLDLSDVAALAVLLRDPRIDVRAIAIDGTGLVHCQAGRRLTRYVLDQLGTPDIPFGCGRQEAGPDGHPFPAGWRAVADADYGLDIPSQAEAGVAQDAVTLIKAAVAGSESSPTIVSLGPLTNLEDAFAADSALADHVAGIQAMLGSVAAPGNVLVDSHTTADQLEWNAYADPSAVAAVFDTDVPIALVPLDATDDVPVPAGLLDRLADVPAAGADLVHELLVRNPSRLAGDEGQQLWDELAALTVTNPDLADWAEATVLVGADGRFTQDDAGRPIRYANGADRVAVEAALIEALSRGDPRPTPFQLAGQLSVTFDGTRCTLTGHSDRDGPHRLTFKTATQRRAGVAIVGTTPPHTWDELLAAFPDANSRAKPPDWLVAGPIAEDAEGGGNMLTVTGNLKEGFYGPLCYLGTWPDVVLTPGTPFEVGSGAIGQ